MKEKEETGKDRQYRFHLTIGYVTADHEAIFTYTEEELEGMTEEDIEERVEADWQDWKSNYIESYYERIL